MAKFARIFLFLLPVLLLSNCSFISSPNGLRVWLDVPVNGLTFPEIQPIQIEGHASSRVGIDRIEISLNGALWQVVNSPVCERNLCSFSLTWQPENLGNYTVSAQAFDMDGQASLPDEAMVNFGKKAVYTDTPLIPTETPTLYISPTPTMTVTPTVTPTVTVTPSPQPVIQFWAEPVQVNAGKCTTIHWNTSHVRSVVFGGIEQPLIGSDEECPCENKTYTLTVTHSDGTIENRNLEVKVNGSCAPVLPPAPTLVVPANGTSLSCRSSQTITWMPVVIPGGISGYQVEIQRSSNNVTWSAFPGSPFTGIVDKSTTIAVECGWYYRWRVRAINTTGGAGAWSTWFYFAIQLS
jgi:hypothetical protein